MNKTTIATALTALQIGRKYVENSLAFLKHELSFRRSELMIDDIAMLEQRLAFFDQVIADLTTQAEPQDGAQWTLNADGLAPCPFCGGDGKISIDYVLGPNEPLYTAMCEKLLTWHDKRFTKGYEGRSRCGGLMSGAFNTREEAIAAWNQRTPAMPQDGAQWEPLADGKHSIFVNDTEFVVVRNQGRHVDLRCEVMGSESSWPLTLESNNIRICRLTPASPTTEGVPLEVAETLELVLTFARQDDSAITAGTEAYINRRIDEARAWLATQRPPASQG